MLSLRPVVLPTTLFLTLSSFTWLSAPGRTAQGTDTTPTLQDVQALLDQGQLPLAEARARQLVTAANARAGHEPVVWADAVDLLVESLLRQRMTSDPAVRPLAERAVRAHERARPVDEAGLARGLRGLGRWADAQGDTAAARAALERAVIVAENAHGPDTAPTVRPLQALGASQAQHGQLDAARAVLERAARVAAATLPPEHPDAIGTQQVLGRVERRVGREAEARIRLQDAVERAMHGAGPDSLLVASTLLDLGQLELEMVGPEQAVPRFQRALAIYERVLGPNHPLLVAPLQNLGLVHVQQGQLDVARGMFQRLMGILETAPSHDARELAAVYIDYGYLQIESGEPEGARDSVQRGIEVATGVYGADSPLLTGYLNNLAVITTQLGDFAQAVRLFEQVLVRDERELGPDHPDLAGGLHNLAGVLGRVGRRREAVPLLERAVVILENARGPEHPTMVRMLANLAAMLERTDEPERAHQTYQRAIALGEKVGQAGRGDLAICLNDYAGFLLARKDPEGARKAADRALALRLELYGPVHPRIAMSLERQARIDLSLDQLDSARARLERAVAIRKQMHGEEHPGVGDALQDLSVACLRQRDWTASAEAAQRAEQIGRAHLRLLARGLSEREALAYAAVRPRGAHVALSAAAGAGPAHPELARAAWDQLIRSRALVFDEMATRRWLTSSSQDPQVRALSQQLQSARTRLARSVVSPARRPSAAQAEATAQAQRDKERLERELAEQLAPLGRQARADLIGLAEVQRALPPHSALLAFGVGAEGSAAAHFHALVARAGSEAVTLVTLGEVAEVEALVTRWRASLRDGTAPAGPLRSNAERAYREVGIQLRTAVWDPVASLLDGAQHLFVVPEGELSWVNFAALPTDEGGYLIESGPLLHVLAAERDLVLESDPRPASPAEAGAVGLLAMGGPDFEATPGRGIPQRIAARFAAAGLFRGVSSACTALRDLRFPRLAAAGREASEVARIYQQGARRRTRVYTGDDASETRLKLECAGHQVLHLATHGFYLDRACRSAAEEGAGTTSGGTAGTAATGTGPTGAGSTAVGSDSAEAENPLLLSGLALAGANRRASASADADDGVLTAEEVAALDLAGTDWVVLSACDTGVGPSAAGEGVLGLRRAFRTAGARTLILSLWPVEDAAAREWMSDLYRERFERHADTATAVRAACLAALRRERASSGSGHPFRWAGFLATGDWR